MTASLLPWPRAKFFSPNTNFPLAGGKVYTYAAGTSTPLATYTDSSQGVANANPVILDAQGEANIWLGAGLSYKIDLFDASNVHIAGFPVDNVFDSGSLLRADLANTSNVLLGDALVGVKQPYTGTVARTQHTKNTDYLSIRDFPVVGDGVANDTAAFQSAAQASNNPVIHVNAGSYLLSTSPSAGASSPLWVIEDGVTFSGAGRLPGAVSYIEDGKAFRGTSRSLAKYTNDASIQVRCGEANVGDINISYATRQGGNGLWLWTAGSDANAMKFVSAGGSSGIDIVNINSCKINFVAAQALAASTIYYVYAYYNTGTGNIDYNFSNTLTPSFGDPFAITPITGWACANGDARQRWIALVELDASRNLLVGGAPAPSGVTGYNLCSYYNRQRVTLQTIPTGNTASVNWDNATIANGLLSSVIIPDGYEPFITFSGTVSNSNAGATTWVGISLNGATPTAYVKIGQSNANYPMPFSVTFPGGSPNYVGIFGGRNTYQVQMKVSAGTATFDTGCIFAGSFEN